MLLGGDVPHELEVLVVAGVPALDERVVLGHREDAGFVQERDQNLAERRVEDGDAHGNLRQRKRESVQLRNLRVALRQHALGERDGGENSLDRAGWNPFRNCAMSTAFFSICCRVAAICWT